MNIRFFIYTLSLAFCFLIPGNAQVTIGMGEAPEKGALLQLKDTVSREGGITATTGGLLLPRVNLVNRAELYPFYKQGAADYTGKAKEIAMLNHCGLVVYNLNRTDEFSPGPYYWDGEQWNIFRAETGNATFDQVNCTDIIVKGVYIKGMPVTFENYLTVNLNVIKTGVFSFSAVSGNGYSFYVTAMAFNEGPMSINVPCQGIPADIQTDKLSITGIDVAAGCQPEVQVLFPVAEYSLNCSSTVVNGQYIKGVPATSSNTITLNVTVASPGSYSITSPLTNGVCFSASGNLSVGTQPVTLICSGSPTINTDFVVTIHANTLQGNNSCDVTVPVILPSMTFAVIGGKDGRDIYSWAALPRLSALTAGDSFGPNGTVKIASLTKLWLADDVDIAATHLKNDAQKPDVVLYFTSNAPPNVAITDALVDYIKKGGCVIYGSSDKRPLDVNILMEGIFGISPAVTQTGGAQDDDVYPVSHLPDDPVVNGPFGNLSGRYWGEDNNTEGSVIITQLPPNSVQVCTARSASKTSQNPGYSIVWYNDPYNFVYFGDSTGAATNNTSTNEYPSAFNSSGLPISKIYGPGSTLNQFVYNSALELNAVAWLLRKAAVSGINPH